MRDPEGFANRDFNTHNSWSDMRDSNPRPSPWQGDILSAELISHMAPPAGFEPATSRLTVLRSDHWTKEAYVSGFIAARDLVDRTGIEPATSSVQTRRSPY